jgi:hypothetical protein
MRASFSVLFLLLASCSPLADLSRFHVQTWPSSENQVLASGDTVRLTFSEAVDRPSAQALLSVSSIDGMTPGDLTWSGRTLTFTPIPALTPAKRYNLEFRGQVSLADGRVFPVVKEVPFFSVTGTSGLRLTSYSPANGATAAVTAPLVLVFDQAVAVNSFVPAFSVSPSVPYTAAWSPDATTVTVSPRSWEGNTLVSWQLSTAVRSAAGVPLAATVNQSFLTNADQIPPAVVSLVPAVATGSNPVVWTAAGADLNAIQKDDGMLLRTSEPVTSSTLTASLRLTPAIKGHWETQSLTPPCEYVFIPEDDWAPGTTYSLQLTGLQDAAGNQQRPYLAEFTPAISYLHVTGITLTGTSSATYGPSQLRQVNFFPVCVPSGVSGALQIAVTLAFDAPFSAPDKTQFALMSFCEPLFPTEGAPLGIPALVTVSFVDDSTAVLTYQGYSVGSPAPDYYRIRIPGGPAGLKTRAGHVLKEDVWLDFVTGS